jgi:hypothetical protein
MDPAARGSAVSREVALDQWRLADSVGRAPVHGSSMLPLLEHGDRVRVRSGVPPRFGQIALAETRSGLVVHRMIGREGPAYLLRGDSTRGADAVVLPANILGHVIALEGLDGRRLDTRGMLWLGRAAAAYARMQHWSAHAPRRPRPSALVEVGLSIEAAFRRPMTPADGFVLAAARLTPADDIFDRARSLGPEDWPQVPANCLRGQIGPLVYRTVAALPEAAAVPQNVTAALRRQYRGSALRALEIEALLMRMLERLAEEGIPVLAHKGIVLGSTVYPEAALRIAADIDLSVPDEDKARAEALVHDIRQALVSDNPDRRSSRGYHIELDGTAHHDVDPALSGAGRWRTGTLDWQGIWARAVPARIAGHQVLVPCATDLMVTLVANAVRRGFQPVRLITDIAATARVLEHQIDWDVFQRAVESNSLDRRSWIALGLAIDWFDAPIPARLAEAPNGVRPAYYERRLVAHKQRRPFRRLPTSVLWAGSTRAAVATAARLLWARGVSRVRGPVSLQ